MNRMMFFLFAIVVFLLLSPLFYSGPTGTNLAAQATITPTAFLYLPFVARNWPSLATPTASPTSTSTATPTPTPTRTPETPTATATATPTSTPAPSPRINLNGTWLYTYSVSETIPSGASWTAVEIPSFVTWDANKPYIWLQRTFTLPPNFPSERVYLDFQGIKYAAKVYLNGTLLGEHRDGFTPFELAVPAGALRASNELLIQVSDWRSALAPEATQGQVSDPRELVDDSLIYPIGSQHYQLGIWQDVALVAYPEVRIKDVFVQTSVRDYQLVLEVTLENLTGSNQSITLSNDVLDGDQIVLTFAPVDASLGPGGIKTMRLEQAWTTPHLWSPDDPYLYRLRSHLAGGDERSVRFGFREFWVAGNEFYLNGTRIHLRATATHPFAFSKQDALHYLTLAKTGNNVIMRLHAQPWPSSWYEAADEVGMLIVWESAYWCYGSGYWVGDDRFWDHFREHLHDQILLQRNHPSNVIWSLENELLLTSGGNQRIQATEARLAGLVGFAKSLDPTRPIMFEGDADPGGQADIINLHYPHEYPVWNLWPNEAWWLEFTNQTDIYPGEISGWPLQKPLYIGEFLWVPMNFIEGASIFLGDNIYRDLIGYHRCGKAAAWSYQLEAYRALGVQGFCPWSIWEGVPNPLLYSLVQEKFAANGLYLREKNARFFGGDTITRTAYLFNDLLQDSPLTVTWELISGTTILDSGSRQFDLNPAEIVQFGIELHAPQVGQESTAEINYTVQRAGTTVFSYEEPIRLYSHRTINAGTMLYLYDPAGTTQTVFASEGITYSPLTDLSAIPAGAEVMIVGGNGLHDSDDWQRIKDFAARGGRALILHQEQHPEGVPLSFTAGGATVAFPRRISHPVLVGTSEDELRFWAPDYLVIDKPLVKPDYGLYQVLIDAGSAGGLKHVGLMELEVMSGTILLSQLDLLPKLAQEPAARKLFQNILDYLAGYHPRSERQLRLLAVTPEEEQAFQVIGFDLEALTGGPGSSSELIFASGDLDQAHLSTTLAQVEQGSILWLHKPSAALLTGLNNFGLSVAAQAAITGQVSIRNVPQAEGLTSYSLFWAEGQAKYGWELPPLNYNFAEMLFSAPSAPADFSNALEVSPAAFTVTAALFNASPDQIALYTNGHMETEIQITQSGTYNLGLLAQGTPAAGEYPAVRIQLDCETLGTLTIDGERQIYYLTAELPAGQHHLRIEFFNDYWAPPEDRNLYFFKLLLARVTDMNWIALTRPAVLVEIQYGSGFILLDGLNWEKPGAQVRKQDFLVSLLVNLGIKLAPPSVYRLEAEEMEITAGAIVSGTDSGVWFATNGTIAAPVNFEGGRYIFSVWAAGTPLGGVYPLFKLAIDGQVVGSQSLRTQTESVYFIEATVTPGVHQLSLSFVNDAYAPPEDRNLFVDKIDIVLQ